MTRNTWIGVLAALGAAFTGSAWQIISRHGVSTALGPLELASLRYGIPAVVLLPLLWRTGLLPRGVSAWQVVGMVMGGGLPFGLVVLAGAQWAPAAHMGVFMAGSVPLFTVLGAWVVHGERLPLQRLMGLGVLAGGIAAVGLAPVSASSGAWRGDLLFLLAGALWAIYTLVFRHSGLGPWQGTALVNAWSAILLLPVLAWWGAPRLASAPLADLAMQAAGQGVLAGLLGLVAYLAAVTRLGAARASLSAALVPLMTALGAAWLLGEPLGGRLLAAVALVMAGVVLASGAWCGLRRAQSAQRV